MTEKNYLKPDKANEIIIKAFQDAKQINYGIGHPNIYKSQYGIYQLPDYNGIEIYVCYLGIVSGNHHNKETDYSLLFKYKGKLSYLNYVMIIEYEAFEDKRVYKQLCQMAERQLFYNLDL